MNHFLAFVVSGVLLITIPAHALESIPEKTTQLLNGQIIFPVTDATAGAENSLSWNYKPTRWGMYEVELVYENAKPTAATLQIGKERFQTTGDLARTLGPHTFASVTRYYLAKSEPFEIRLDPKPKGLKAVLFRPAPEGKPIRQDSETITLHARDAITHSVMMRYEPAANKNCLGYWTNPSDSAEWKFTVTQPGTYEIELWQGCGKGQGGSEVGFRITEPLHSSKPGFVKEGSFIVEDTGHFQNFIPRNLGQVTLGNGGYSLFVKPLNKKAAAVMDIRQILLKPGKIEENPNSPPKQ